MIFDTLVNLKKYKNIPNLDLIVEFIMNNKLLALPEGNIEINGKDLYVKVLRYFPKSTEENYFEIHKIYTDVQVILKGIEKMQVVGTRYLQTVTKYNREEDFQFFSAQRYVSDIVVGENEFVVFFPNDAHKPGCYYEKLDEPIFKLVFKTKP